VDVEVLLQNRDEHQDPEVGLGVIELGGITLEAVEMPPGFRVHPLRPLVEGLQAGVNTQSFGPRKAIGAEQVHKGHVEALEPSRFQSQQLLEITRCWLLDNRLAEVGIAPLRCTRLPKTWYGHVNCGTQ
jgi:hypothetical protein